jgi:tetratricopeptide (TPR) repeat protein
MADFLKDIWEAIPGDNAATKWATLAAIAAVIMFVGWIFGLFTKPKKPDPDTAHTEAVAGGATEKLAEKLIEQANRAQAAESEAGALRGQVDEQENQISALTEAIESLQERRQEASLENRATIDDALAQLAEGRAEEATALLRTIAEEKAAAGAAANREAAAAYRHLGAMAFLNDTREALSAYTKAVELDPDDADGWNELGHLQRRLGELADAERSYQKVLALGNRIEDQELIAVATGNLGILYATRGDLDDAEAMYNKSLELCETLGRKEGMANQYGNLGNLYAVRGDLDDAEAMYKKSLELNKTLGRKEGMASDYGNLGLLYATRGDLDDAEAMYKKSLEIEKALGRKEGMAKQYGNLGNLYKARGDLESACEHYRNARALFVEIGMPHRVEKCDKLMKEAGCEEA